MPSLLPRNMLLIAKREYLEQIRGRAFRLSTILVPLLVIFLLGVSSVTGRKMAMQRHIAIAADNPTLAADIRSRSGRGKTRRLRCRCRRAVYRARPRRSPGACRQQIPRRPARHRKLLHRHPQRHVYFTVFGRSHEHLASGKRHRSRLPQSAPRATGSARRSDRSRWRSPVHLETLLISGSGQTGKSQGMTPFYKAMLMTFLMTMPILLYGMDMARSIIEEKGSRIFEVMLAVARPDDLLTGKLLGVGAVGSHANRHLDRRRGAAQRHGPHGLDRQRQCPAPLHRA